MMIFDTLFPKRCAFCGNITTEQSGICKDCAGKLPLIEGEICLRCGCKVTDCTCNNRHRYYTAVTAPLYYSEFSRLSVLRIKHSRKFGGIDTLARLVTASVKDNFENIGFDMLTVVPMTPFDKSKRGFNQTEMLGKVIAKGLGIKYDAGILSKIYDTRPQKELKSFERLGNVSGVFHINNPNKIKGKTILLFDDIITTGSTVNECAKMLSIYGAEKVYVCSVLLTKQKNKITFEI